MMVELILENVLTYGIFALLFVWLLNDTKKHNRKREERYQATIAKNQIIIAQQAQDFTRMSDAVREIKDVLIKKELR